MLAVLLCAIGLIPIATPAAADPKEGDIGEKLDKAIQDYIAAQETLDNSKSEQESIKEEIKSTKTQVKALKIEVGDFAEASYMNGGLPPAIQVLAAGTPETAVDTLSITNYLGADSGKRLSDLINSQEDLKAQQEALEDEIDDAEKAEEELSTARDAAAQAMVMSGGDWASGPEPGNFPKAEPAPRNPDGSLPEEGCSVDDPVTDGCISPRTEHAMTEAVVAGFTREVSSCYRSLMDGGDHPSGKACDYTVGSQGGFAEGEARVYGDNCAAWFVENAEALGVKGIIWYNQLWTPATGWGPYNGGNTGDASLDHANHVHVSML